MPARHARPHSNKLCEAGDGSDQLADLVLADFLACVGDELPGDILHLFHAEPGSHHAHARAHDSAHAAVTFARGLSHQRLGTRKLGKERLHLVGRSFLGQEVEDNTQGFLDRRLIDAEIRGEASDEIVHDRRQPHPRQVFAIMYTRPRHDKHSRRRFQRSAPTVANVQRNVEQSAPVEMKIAAHYKILRVG
jgi:hypothetical protein